MPEDPLPSYSDLESSPKSSFHLIITLFHCSQGANALQTKRSIAQCTRLKKKIKESVGKTCWHCCFKSSNNLASQEKQLPLPSASGLWPEDQLSWDWPAPALLDWGAGKGKGGQAQCPPAWVAQQGAVGPSDSKVSTAKTTRAPSFKAYPQLPS